MYIGIDLGTSGVKAILMDEAQRVVANAHQPLSLCRPQPLWSEQDPEHWWGAVEQAMQALKMQHDLGSVKAIALSGQMHGATLLDSAHQILRPAILWNDGRSQIQCETLERLVPHSRTVTGNLMMPGFTAPKIKWLQENEPEIFAQIDKVLLPKDYLRYRMSGVFASDMSDAAGTMWLDVAKRDWDDDLLQACGLARRHMPQLYEGNQITGYLSEALCQCWGIPRAAIVAGGGDNAAGAIGVGLYQPNQAMLSLGTSGVYFVVTEQFLSKPEQAVHSFCHALPERWHLMSVMLSAASCLDWACKILFIDDVATLFSLLEKTVETPSETLLEKKAGQSASEQLLVYFLPYLSGERTPHNNPNATGVLFGLTHSHNAIDIAKGIVKGVSFALADCMDTLHSTGVKPSSIMVIGGGAQSHYWRQLLSDISGFELQYCLGGEVGPALGAAKLAQIACQPERPLEQILHTPPVVATHQPNLEHHRTYQVQRTIFRRLYQQLLPLSR